MCRKWGMEGFLDKELLKRYLRVSEVGGGVSNKLLIAHSYSVLSKF